MLVKKLVYSYLFTIPYKNVYNKRGGEDENECRPAPINQNLYTRLNQCKRVSLIQENSKHHSKVIIKNFMNSLLMLYKLSKRLIEQFDSASEGKDKRKNYTCSF